MMDPEEQVFACNTFLRKVIRRVAEKQDELAGLSFSMVVFLTVIDKDSVTSKENIRAACVRADLTSDDFPGGVNHALEHAVKPTLEKCLAGELHQRPTNFLEDDSEH